jgi:site-specific DNA-methyltransferase (adenine-specific)
VTPYYADAAVQLYRGDALAVLRELPDASVDALITDPPYSSGGMIRGDRATPGSHRKYSGTITDANILNEFTGDSRDQRAYGYWCALWLGEAMRVVKPGGIACLFTDWRQLPATTDAIQSGGWVWRGIVPWVKRAFRPQSGRLANQCEYVVWGSNGPIPVDHTAPIHSGFFEANPPRDREHITQKPVEVMRQLVKVVPEGGTVLDPFMGSGTTGIAAVLERRLFVGAELSAHYSGIAEQRIRTASGQTVAAGSQEAIDFGGAA